MAILEGMPLPALSKARVEGISSMTNSSLPLMARGSSWQVITRTDWWVR